MQHHNDRKVIKLLISRHPPALVSVLKDKNARLLFLQKGLPAAKRFNNHNVEIFHLLSLSHKAFREHRFPRLIELCGTSEALEALVAAHSEDDLPLAVLGARKLWNNLLARIKQRPSLAVAKLFYKDKLGATALGVATDRAPLDVLESMILLAKLDAEKRNILDIPAIGFTLPLHNAAQVHPDPATIKLLVCHHPSALLAKDHDIDTPLDCAIKGNKTPAVATIIRTLTTVYEHSNFSALIRLCGTSDAIQALAARSTDNVPLLVLCQCESWEAVYHMLEDWKLSRRCLTRSFVVLVEHRVVGEMAIFVNHHNQVTVANHYPIRSPSSFRHPRPTSYPTLVAYNAQLLLFPSMANPLPCHYLTPPQ